MIDWLVTTTRRISSFLLSFAGRSHRGAVLLLLLASLLCGLPGFFTIPPMDRDESRFAQASRQMLETGDFVNIRYQNEARNKKPVGIYWLQAAAVKLVGDSPSSPIWVYRLPSLLGAVLAVLLTYWALLPVVGRLEAFLAGLLMAASVMVGMEARTAKTDAVLLATVVAAMGALIRAYLDPAAARRGPVWLILGAALGAGLLIKGPITLMVVALSSLMLAFRRRSADFLLALRPLRTLALALLIALPWFIAITIETQGDFFKGSLGEDMLSKIGSAAEQHWGPPGYYLATVWVFAWPAAPFLFLSLLWLWRRRWEEEVFVLLAWLLPTWLVFEIISTKLPHYVLPTYPALMGLVALALGRGEEALPSRRRAFLLSGLWIFPLMVGGGLTMAMIIVEKQFLPLSLAASLLSVLAGLVAVRIASKNLAEAVPAAVLSACLLSFGVMQGAVPMIRSIWLSRTLADEVAKVSPCPAPRLAIAGYAEPSFVFLTRTDTLLTDAQSAADFLAGGGCRLAIADASRAAPGAMSENEKFLARLSAGGHRGEVLSEVEGSNVNGFRQRRMVIWRLASP